MSVLMTRQMTGLRDEFDHGAAAFAYTLLPQVILLLFPRYKSQEIDEDFALVN